LNQSQPLGHADEAQAPFAPVRGRHSKADAIIMDRKPQMLTIVSQLNRHTTRVAVFTSVPQAFLGDSVETRRGRNAQPAFVGFAVKLNGYSLQLAKLVAEDFKSCA
jgi:hypothetical protein